MTDSNETPFVRLPVREMRDEPAPQRAAQEGDLPPLPEPLTLSRGDEDGAIQLGYTADQMREYARLALAAAGGGVPQGWDVETVGNVFATIRWLLGVDGGGGTPSEDLQSIISTVAAWAEPGPRAAHAEAMKQAAAARAMLASSPQPEAAPAVAQVPKEETPAELALREIACFLGVGGYNATTVDADVYRKKIMEELINSATTDAENDKSPLLDGEGWTVTLANGHAGHGWYAHCEDYPEEGAVFIAAAPEAPAQAAPSAGEVERGDVVAFEFYNRETGHAIVDYSVNTHVGNLSADKGYEARPLVYADKREDVTDGSKPIPLWQAREALDELEAAARGDTPFNHQAAAVVRAALSHKEQP